MKLKFWFVLLCASSVLGCKAKRTDSVSPCRLFIGDVGLLGSYNSNVTEGFVVDAFLVNNTDDTLHYISGVGLDSRALVIDTKSFRFDWDTKNPFGRFSLGPHEGESFKIFLKPISKADTAINLRVGLHLLEWPGKFERYLSYDSLIAKAPVMWSSTVRFKMDVKRKKLSRDTAIMKREALEIFPVVSAKERRNYALGADIAYRLKINEIKDQGLIDRNSFAVRLRLSNKSLDTLRFISLSCDSAYVFSPDDKTVAMMHGGLCLGNYPVVYKIPPQTERVFWSYISYANKSIKSSRNFRIGMILCKWTGSETDLAGISDKLKYFSIITADSSEKAKRSIWSNEIKIPSSN